MYGAKRVSFESKDSKLLTLAILLNGSLLPLSDKFSLFGIYVFDLLTILSCITLTALASFGLGHIVKIQRMQKCLDYSGLKNVDGLGPRLIKVIEIDDHRSKLIVSSVGIGTERYHSKKNDLESSFQQKIEKIVFSKDRKFIEINLCSRELPKMIPYSEVEVIGGKSSSFVLGESLSGGVLTQDLTDLPHLLIGGTTGGGKSVFFKGTILNLLKTTPHIQMYLIDLKKGIEVKEFSELPNVKIAKDEGEAVKVLQAVKDEMDRRYEYINDQSDKKIINPKKDKKDLIVIGIDEASVLYGKTSSSKSRKHLMLKARELTDDLAKLARAAGIHLIIATQKPIKDSIDTKTLENLPGRMSFKMSTHAGSNSMLGNAKAYRLPDVKGRAIWKGGNKFIEVQTPFISSEDIKSEIESIKAGFKSKKYSNFQEMLSLSSQTTENQNKLKMKLVKSNSNDA